MTLTIDCERALAEALGSDRIERDVALGPMTTFRIGGPADLLYRARTPDELALAVQTARDLAVPHFLLGRGANILVGDGGFRGLIIRSEVGGIDFLDDVRVRAGAGENAGACDTAGLFAPVFVRWDVGPFGGCVRYASGQPFRRPGVYSAASGGRGGLPWRAS